MKPLYPPSSRHARMSDFVLAVAVVAVLVVSPSPALTIMVEVLSVEAPLVVLAIDVDAGTKEADVVAGEVVAVATLAVVAVGREDEKFPHGSQTQRAFATAGIVSQSKQLESGLRTACCCRMHGSPSDSLRRLGRFGTGPKKEQLVSRTRSTVDMTGNCTEDKLGLSLKSIVEKLPIVLAPNDTLRRASLFDTSTRLRVPTSDGKLTLSNAGFCKTPT